METIIAQGLQRALFGIFQHSFCCKISKKIEGGPFEDIENVSNKSHSAKKLNGGPLGFFNIHSVAKHQKIAEGTL